MIPGERNFEEALLDPETMHLLDISPGDFVIIEGSRRAVAKVSQLSFNDWNMEKIRIRYITRMNAGVSVGDTVKVIKMTEKAEAKRIVLESNIKFSQITKDKIISCKQYLLAVLNAVHPVKNNYVSLNIECNICSIITFRVVDLEPEAAVFFTDKTSLEFSDKTVILTNKDILTNNTKIIRDIPSNYRCKNCNEKIYPEEIIQCGPSGKLFCIFCWESHRWSHGKSPAIGISYQSDGTFSGFDGTEQLK